MQPKLRIIESGWEGYTGPLFGIEFVDGMSVDVYSKSQGEQVSNLLRVETDEGKNLSISQSILDSQHTSMSEDAIPESVVTKEVLRTYSVVELRAIADEKGIEGLREIGKLRNLKDNSISGLIDKILAAQPKPAPVEVVLAIEPAVVEVEVPLAAA